MLSEENHSSEFIPFTVNVTILLRPNLEKKNSFDSKLYNPSAN